ncbi:TPA: hypothetical protein ACGORP_000090 [Streptococcus suis]
MGMLLRRHYEDNSQASEPDFSKMKKSELVELGRQKGLEFSDDLKKEDIIKILKG